MGERLFKKCRAFLCQRRFQVIRFYFLLYGITFFLVLPLLCCDLRHSVYNFRSRSSNQEERRLRRENDERLAKNEPIVQMYADLLSKSNKSPPLLHSEHIDVGITVVTVSRNRKYEGGYQPRHLTQVLGRLVDLINITNTELKYGIFLCNVDGHPDSYREATSLNPTFTTFQKFKGKQAKFVDIFEKEKMDYIYCIEETLKRNASNVFMIEDDSYPHKDLFLVLEKVISYPEENQKTNNVTFIKFYHPERLLGYLSLQLERLPEMFALGAVFGTILVVPVCLYLFKESDSDVRLLWILSALYFSLGALAIGRVNLIELRRFSAHMYQVTPAASCCTQAMFFPQDGARSIVKHLKEVTCKKGYGKDMALEEIRGRGHYKALMVQPNLFIHTGLFSTLRRGMVNPFLLG
ncbi:post-GPI attachment to proteins factor 4-like [Haliotis rubra]|uniref:post-GPI attachment to proteins factor 4-like n=1 Tax=Haliotis rubra TaxID=36100 RepID=UPI001EE5A99E|nr:post-GPI attachment to proteins factor 4-like [Haliotis rubra]